MRETWVSERKAPLLKSVWLIMWLCFGNFFLLCLNVNTTLRRLRTVALQVIDPWARCFVAFRTLAGDGQLSKPWPCRGGVQRDQDVVGLFGEDGVHSFDSKTGVVNLRRKDMNQSETNYTSNLAWPKNIKSEIFSEEHFLYCDYWTI